MTGAELKAQARAQLGGGIFKNEWLTALAVCFIAMAICSAAGGLLSGIGALILSGPMTYGVAYVFLKQSRDGQPMNVADMFRGFPEDFGGTLLLGLLSSLFTFLWGLLLVVPGIVKAYSYSQAFFVKVDRPEYDWRACMDESIQLMDGHKMDLFILDLSFLGWYIVGALCIGVGTLWVYPYHMAARTKFYEELTRYQMR